MSQNSKLSALGWYGAWRYEAVLSTAPGSRDVVAHAVADLYSICGAESPWVIWCDGPMQMAFMRNLFPAILTCDYFDWKDIETQIVIPHCIRLVEMLRVDTSQKQLIVERTKVRTRSEYERLQAAGGVKALQDRARDCHPHSADVITHKISERLMRRQTSIRDFDVGLTEHQIRLIARPIVAGVLNAATSSLHLDWASPAWSMPIFAEPYLQEVAHGAVQPMRLWDHWVDLCTNCSGYCFMEHLAFVCDKPESISLDQEMRPHHESECAIKFRDGFGLYAWHGVTVPDYVVTNPAKITAGAIVSQENAEVRRVMMERYGLDKLLESEHAQWIHSDEFGDLYRIFMRPNTFRFGRSQPELVLLLRVQNSTPEPDGSIRNYVLRVPPEMMRARQAVAWTFGMLEHEYNPVIQT